ncbi:unnamed protein product [Trifolium pratense]|uniref:Uncharacterized protein n=1 Tax=Trifolium pratense TaxID=57577 RepID=A0ACB0KBT2_TRIPR|nr:unnamed protein product [Trifolium pratense]
MFFSREVLPHLPCSSSSLFILLPVFFFFLVLVIRLLHFFSVFISPVHGSAPEHGDEATAVDVEDEDPPFLFYFPIFLTVIFLKAKRQSFGSEKKMQLTRWFFKTVGPAGPVRFLKHCFIHFFSS